MSRAFVKENDSWEYCTKAGETCFYAERGRECKRSDCLFVTENESATAEQIKDRENE